MTTPPPQGQAPYPPQGQNPYGQPPAGAPYPPQPGQQGIPQQPYPAYNQGGPVPPPAAPSRGGRAKKFILRIVGFILVAILIAVGKWYFGQSDAETTSVGSCMHNKGTQGTPDLEEVDCSSSDAEFKVVEKFDDTSDSTKCEAVKTSEIAYYQQGKGHNLVLCLKRTK